MKKIFFLFLLILQSCNNDDDSPTNNLVLNPPQWIHGTWLEGVDGTSINNGVRFTINDTFLISPNGEISMKDVGGQGSIINETITNSKYQITLSSNYLPELVSYTFLKVDVNTINQEKSGIDLLLKKQ